MDPIVNDLIDMMPDIMVVAPITRNGMGTIGTPGTSFNVSVKIKEGEKLVRGEGKTVTATIWAITGGVYGLNLTDFQYTLPARFRPRKPEPVAIGNATDENGMHHQIIYFGSRQGA